MELRDNQGEDRGDGLEDECKGKNGEIDNGQDHPTVCFTFFQRRLSFLSIG
jgi:hypothetical protein